MDIGELWTRAYGRRRYRGLWTWGLDRVDTGYGRSMERELTGPYPQSLKGSRNKRTVAVTIIRYETNPVTQPACYDNRVRYTPRYTGTLTIMAIVHEGIRGSRTGWPR